MLRLIAILGIGACARPGFFVADIQPTAGGIAVTKCAFDDRGKATTDNCTTETIAIVPPPVVGGSSLPVEAPRQPRPAPTVEQVHAALSTPAIHDLLAKCRMTYSKASTFQFRITIDRKGGVGDVSPSAMYEAPFVECATRALRTANIAHFDGDPVTYDEALEL